MWQRQVDAFRAHAAADLQHMATYNVVNQSFEQAESLAELAIVACNHVESICTWQTALGPGAVDLLLSVHTSTKVSKHCASMVQRLAEVEHLS